MDILGNPGEISDRMLFMYCIHVWMLVAICPIAVYEFDLVSS